MRQEEIQALPAAIQRFADDPRVTVRRGGELSSDGRCIAYWMQRAQRGLDNPALDLAIRLGNATNLSVVAYVSISSNYPNANLRHYVFLGQGLRDIEEELAARNVALIVRRPPNHHLGRFLNDVKAALLVGDENHCREPEQWRTTLAGRIKMPFLTVDADVVVPSNLFTRHFYAMHHFKPHLERELPKYLKPQPRIKAKCEWNRPPGISAFDPRGSITHGWKNLDRSVGPVDEFTGGTRAALERLKNFVLYRLKDYEKRQSQPECDGTSQLSPYLHFGHIGPLTVALAAQKAVREGKASQAAYDAFTSELIGWRELSINFVKHVPNYDSFECAPGWAKKTLREHASDTRPYRYDLSTLEKARTHDDMWNAAQMQMVKSGWMHNYMRMYWAKKILEWSPTPDRAYDYAVLLNDKYEIDGRDPNGYAGIAWAIAGVHDRPWFDRPIFGTIRYMSRESTGRKFNSKQYIEKYCTAS